MYRRGIPAPKIAEGAGVAETTLRYHLAIAARQEPSIRAEHESALPDKSRRLTVAGLRNLDDILALYEFENRLPATHSASAREKALAAWLHRRRQEAMQGPLAPAYERALEAIPSWRDWSSKRAYDELRWKQRLSDVAAYRARGNNWPRHNKTDDRAEHALGVWLHTQRISDRAGKLAPAKKAHLDEVIPGWRQGRGRQGADSRTGRRSST
jgi:hypothetical protein